MRIRRQILREIRNSKKTIKRKRENINRYRKRDLKTR